MSEAFGLQPHPINSSYMDKYEYILDQNTGIAFSDLPSKPGFITAEIIESFVATNSSSTTMSLIITKSTDSGQVITSSDYGRITIITSYPKNTAFTFPIGMRSVPLTRYYAHCNYSEGVTSTYIETDSNYKNLIESYFNGKLYICVIPGITINTWGKIKLCIWTLD